MRLYRSSFNKNRFSGGGPAEVWEIVKAVGKFILPLIGKVASGAAEGFGERLKKKIAGETPPPPPEKLQGNGFKLPGYNEPTIKKKFPALAI